jgi:hypothetical protein
MENPPNALFALAVDYSNSKYGSSGIIISKLGLRYGCGYSPVPAVMVKLMPRHQGCRIIRVTIPGTGIWAHAARLLVALERINKTVVEKVTGMIKN